MAQDSGGTLQPRSGGFWARPADLYTPDRLIECKEREAAGGRGFTIRREWLEHILVQAGEDGKDPVLVFRFKGDNRRWAIIPFEDLLLLARAAFHPYRTPGPPPSNS